MWSLVLPLGLAAACRDDGDGDDDDTTGSTSGPSSTTDPSDTSVDGTMTSVGTDTDVETTTDPPTTTAETSETGPDVQCGDGNGTSGELCFGPIVTLVDGLPSAAVAVADFDGDGHTDVASAHLDGVRIMAGDGLGGFAAPVGTSDTAPVHGLVAAAIDDDASIDLVAAHGEIGEIAVLLGAGDGTFANPVLVALDLGAAPRALAVLDVDGDGLADIVVVDDLAARVHIVQQQAPGSFVAADSIDVGGSPLGLAAGDLDGANGPDLVVSNFAGASVGVLLHAGGLAFEIADSLEVGQGPRGVALVDLDGDGDLDVATADAEDDTASVAFGDGEGGLGVDLTLPVGLGPRAITSGDLDNDGTVDLALASNGASVVTVLLRDPAVDGVAFLPAILVNTVLAPDDVAFADFNEDGLGDLVVASAVQSGGVVAHVSDP